MDLHCIACIMENLPGEDIGRNRAVCKSWNDMLKSCYFLENWINKGFWNQNPRVYYTLCYKQADGSIKQERKCWTPKQNIIVNDTCVNRCTNKLRIIACDNGNLLGLGIDGELYFGNPPQGKLHQIPEFMVRREELDEKGMNPEHVAELWEKLGINEDEIRIADLIGIAIYWIEGNPRFDYIVYVNYLSIEWSYNVHCREWNIGLMEEIHPEPSPMPTPSPSQTTFEFGLGLVSSFWKQLFGLQQPEELPVGALHIYACIDGLRIAVMAREGQFTGYALWQNGKVISFVSLEKCCGERGAALIRDEASTEMFNITRVGKMAVIWLAPKYAATATEEHHITGMPIVAVDTINKEWFIAQHVEGMWITDVFPYVPNLALVWDE